MAKNDKKPEPTVANDPKLLDNSPPAGPKEYGKNGPKTEQLRADLKRYIIGQEEALNAVTDIYRLCKVGFLPKDRPIGSFLFLGPTGSGKTRMIEALAMCLGAGSKGFIEIDCGEYQHSHEIAKLIGSPPGYLGHGQTQPIFSQKHLDNLRTDKADFSLVLFNEIEKANDALFNILLGILDKARLKLGDNSSVDFSKTMIFMTSNLGATKIDALFKPRIGFTLGQIEESPVKTKEKIRKIGLDAVKKRFFPEFINRIDKIVVFSPLNRNEVERVLGLELFFAKQRVRASRNNINLAITKEAREFLLREGFSQQYGARYIKRAINQLLLLPLAKWIEDNNISIDQAVQVGAYYDSGTDKLVFYDQDALIANLNIITNTAQN